MAELAKEQKPLVGWIIFSIFFFMIVAGATLGTGIYAIIESNKINDEITNELDFIQKTFHDDGVCISIDKKKQVSFIKCNIIDGTNTYNPVEVVLDPSADSETLIQGNNENLKINFQTGITVPGMDFVRTLQGGYGSVQDDVGTEINTIHVSNPFVMKQPNSAFIFGSVGSIDNPFPMNDANSEDFGNPQNYRAYNLFYTGGFIDTVTSSSLRCSTSLGLLGSSMYVLSKSTGDFLFCHCIGTGTSTRTEYCTSPLIQNAITLAIS